MLKKICSVCLAVMLMTVLLLNNAMPMASAAGSSSTVSSTVNTLKITKQPVSVTVSKGTVAKVSVAASGDKLTYRWYHKNKGASKYVLSSVKTNYYSVKMSSSVHGRQVYCVVKDKYGKTVKTNAVKLSMGKTLKITKQTTAALAPKGMVAKVSVAASGEGLKYKWYHRNKGAAKYALSSVTKNYYALTMDSKYNGRQVYCVVTDKYGSTVTSKVVTFTLGKTLKITKQPVSVTAAKGTAAKVSLAVSGDKVTYQWYHKNKGAKKFTLSSVKTNYYAAKMSSSVHGRQVYCVIKDRYGKTVKTNTVKLSMGKTLKITKQPVSIKRPAGMTAKVTVTASGEGLKYKWYHKNKGAAKYSLSSVTTNYYSLKMASAYNGRQVYCVVTDKYGSPVTSNVVTFTLGKTLKITKQPVSVKTIAGKTAKVTVTASGDGLKYKWYHKNKGAAQYSLSSVTTNYYSLKMASGYNGRQVYCVVTDAYGKTAKSNVVTFTLGKTLTITKQPVSVKTIAGKTAKVTVTASGDGLKYKWYHKNKGAAQYSLSSVTTNYYSLKMASGYNGRQVYCVVTDAYGVSKTSSIAELSMATKLQITSQPVSGTMDCGTKHTVTIVAQGDALTYAWYVKAPGESVFALDTAFTSNTYECTANHTTHGTSVYCVVTDTYGDFVTSDVITLAAKHLYDDGTVTKEPTCTVPGERTYTCTECPDSYVVPVDSIGHDMSGWVVIEEPTVKHSGLERRECQNDCDYYEENVLDQLEVLYTITVNTGVSDAYTVGVGNNGKYTLEDPARFGYVFKGWQDSKGNSFNATGLVFENTTVEAVWEADNTDALSKLIERTEAGVEQIKITSDITVNQPIYISYNTTIYADGDYKIKRAADYAGDLFVVGQDKEGTPSVMLQRTASLTLGGGKGLLTIDGNRDALTVTPHGSALFVSDSSTVNLYDGVRIANHKKVGNSRIHDHSGYVGETTRERVGGAAMVILSATVNMYGGVIENNIVATEYTVVEESSKEIAGCGGAIYNMGNLNMYGGKVANNEALRGGGIYNARIAYLFAGEISNNISHSYGGAISSSSGSNADLYLGAEGEGDTLLIKDNRSVRAGGAIYSGTVSPIIVYGNTTFQNNYTESSGGAIYATGTLQVKDTVFEGNECVWSGGAIYHQYGNAEYAQRLFVAENCTFNGNKSSLGGAITFSAASSDMEDGAVAEITNCAFLNNASVAHESNEGNGGAIYITRKSEVTLDNCSFKFNTAAGKAGAVSVHSSANLSVSNCEFESNTAVTGGALYATSEATITVSKTEFTANKAVFKGESSGGNGGALYTYDAMLTVSNVEMYQNQAANNGGALYLGGNDITLDSSCEFIGNSAGGHGGAIYATYETLSESERIGTKLTVNGVLFKSNTALAGGAISARSESVLDFKNVQFIENATPDAAVSTITGGGAIYSNNSVVTMDTVTFDKNASGYYGGALRLDTCEFTINNSSIKNSTGGTGGAFYANGGEGAVTAFTLQNNKSGLNGVIYFNNVKATFGELIATENESVSGGVIYVSNRAEVMVKDSTLTNNKASNGGVAYLAGKAKLTFKDSVLELNNAKNGGAAYVSETAELMLNGATVTKNVASANGGAVYVLGAVLNADAAVEISQNTASANGGAVYVSIEVDEDDETDEGVAGAVTIDGAKLIQNTANHGGAVYSNRSNLTIKNGALIDQNTAVSNGGAVYLTASEVAVSGTTTQITNNVATNYGGAFYVTYYTDAQGVKHGGVLNVADITLNGNTALYGGAVGARTASTVTLTGVSLTNNSTPGATVDNKAGGGAIYANDSTVTLSNVTASGNASGYYGGVILTERTALVLEEGTSFSNNNGGTGAVLHVTGGSVTANTVSFLNNVSAANGVIYLNGGNYTFTNLTATNNSSTWRSGLFYVTGADTKATVESSVIAENKSENGGAFYIGGGETTIVNSNVSKNTATTSGGVFYAVGGKLVIRDSTIEENTAKSHGGALYAKEAVEITISDSTFQKNQANSNGGAIYLYRTPLMLTDSAFRENSTNASGGAINNVGGVITATGNNTFVANTAATHGGAIYLSYIKAAEATETTPAVEAAVGVLTMTGGTFTNNTAMGGGAVSARTGCEASFNGTSFHKNSVQGYAEENDGDGEGGGAIYVGFGTVNLTNVTLTENTSEGFGGAIDAVKGALTIADSELTNNLAGQGGAIYSIFGSTITISGSSFTANESTASSSIASQSGGDIGGGAISTDQGTLTVSGTTFDGNKTGYYGAAIRANNAKIEITDNSVITNSNGATGAALYFKGGCVVTISDSSIIKNTAKSNGVVYINGGSLTATNVTATENTAFNGGVLYTSGSSTKVEIKNSHWNNNTATSGGAMYISGATVTIVDGELNNNKATNGGAVYQKGGKFTVTGAAFSENTATNGGVIYTEAGTATFGKDAIAGTNTASEKGGAVYAIGTAAVTVTGATFEQNKAKNGGAVYVAEATVTLGEAALLTENEATTGNGGAVYAINNAAINVNGATLEKNTAANGGAVYVGGAKLNTSENAQFNQNVATGNGGALYVVYYEYFANEGDTETTVVQSEVSVEGAVLTENTGMRGGALYVTNSEYAVSNTQFVKNTANDDNYGGGAIYNTVATGTLENVTFTENTSVKGGAVALHSGSEITVLSLTATKNTAHVNSEEKLGIGGVFYVNNSTLNLNGTDLSVKLGAEGAANTAVYGGAIYAEYKANVNISNAQFAYNTATVHGGAMYATADTTNVLIANSYFNNNSAVNNGGAIYAAQVDMEIADSTFHKNTANLGGAVYNTAATVTLNDVTFTENTVVKNSSGSNGNGGAVCVVGGTVIASGDNLFSKNTAENHGGAVYVSYTTNADETKNPGILNMTNGVFSENTAIAGGAISSRTACQVTLTGTKLNGNKATSSESSAGGGAIYSNDNTLTLSSVVLDGNSTAYYGGAITAQSATVTIKDNTQIKNNTGTTGAALNFRNAGTYTLQNVSVTDNVATSGSGVIYVNGSVVLNITDLTASGNQNNNGGVVYASGNATITINTSQFSNNAALSYGGAIDHRSAKSLTVSNSIFTQNKAGVSGGAIYANGAGTVTLNNCTFTGNEALASKKESGTICRGGGAVFVNGVAKVVVTGGSFTNNKAAGTTDNTTADQEMTDCGGAIAVNGGNLTVNNATFTGNEANNGGAIGTSRAPETVMSINGCVFTGNIGAKNGGGVYVQNGVKNETDSIVLTDCEFVNNTATGSSGASVYVRTNSSATIKNLKSSGGTWGYQGAVYATGGARITLSGTVALDAGDTIYVTGSGTSAVVSYSTTAEKEAWTAVVGLYSSATITYQNTVA